MTCQAKGKRRRKVEKRRRTKLRVIQDQNTVRQLQEKVLRATGLWQMIRSLGCNVQSIEGLSYPPIEVERGNDSTSDAAITRIVEEVRHLLRKGLFAHPPMPAAITNQEFLRVAVPLFSALANYQESQLDQNAANAARLIRQAVSMVHPDELEEQFYSSMSQNIRGILLKYSRMNRNLYYVTEEHTKRYHFVVHKAAPRFRKIQVDGGRVAFQCAHLVSHDVLRWVSWDCEELGISGPAGRLPVFVQQHVLDRIVGPWSRLSAVVGTESSLHEMLSRSLSEPKISATDDPLDYLVEYGRDGVKLGYLVAQIFPDAVLVRTFLFLTMGGTPEGNKLRSRLRKQQYGSTHLMLDSLENVMKEVRKDPGVRSIFKECGCGEVFEQVLMAEESKSAFAK